MASESAPKPLSDDLEQLIGRIKRSAELRASNPSEPAETFEGFETFDAVVGGMGVVIQARDPKLDRLVAIKLWKQGGPEAQAALLAEARTLAKLSHPNVVTVYEANRWNERVYFVMEWIAGVNGQEWLATPRTWQETRDVFVAAGRGLAAAHDQNIQHSDFKPSNMLIGDDGRVLVADFDVAESLGELDDFRGSNRRGGTLMYMAPERLQNQRGDERSDQFSFCVALWRALYGVRPFPGNTREELLVEIHSGLPQFCVRSPSIPSIFGHIVFRGLSFLAESRFLNMHELVEMLANVHDEEPEGAPGTGEGADGETVEGEGPLLSAPATEAAPPKHSWRGVVLGLSSAGLIWASCSLLGAPDRREAGAPEIGAQDDRRLSTKDSEAIAMACLAPAGLLAETDAAKADEAAEMAVTIAGLMKIHGDTAEAQRAAARIGEAAELLWKGRLPTNNDTTSG